MIFYLHIPKTGGQTLATRLGSAFPIGRSDILGADLVYPDGVGQLQRMALEKDFVERHLSGPVLKDIQNLDILTTIREPLSQIVSNYLHIRREPENYLHQVARLLSPHEFFRKFGDFLANQQSRYLDAAFFTQDIDPEPFRILTRRMYEVLDRIRWVVPTEAIDQFVPLWMADVRRHVPSSAIYVNVAQKDSDYEDLLDLVRGIPRLYYCDLLLWQAAQQRFAEYREKILRTIVTFDGPDNASRAHWEEGNGIWLRSGWYPPQIEAEFGPTWWAGPQQYSEIAYRRAPQHRYLRFSVLAVCGVSHNQIEAVAPDQRTRLALNSSRQASDRWDYWIELDGLPIEGTLYLWVPEVWAPTMVDKQNLDTERRSFVTCDWSFAEIGR
jgi:hypothetical protein